MSDPLNKRDRVDDDDAVADERPNVSGSEPERARVYDRPERGGRSAWTWVLIAIIVIALILWLLF